MKLPSLVMYHVRKIVSMSTYEARDYLKKAGFKQIGCGCESVVFSREGFDYVIKIQFSPFYNSPTNKDNHDESKTIVPNEHAFVKTWVFQGINPIIVQEKVEHTIEDKWNDYAGKFRKYVKKARALYNIQDLHEGNVGVIRGRLVIFDWCLSGL